MFQRIAVTNFKSLADVCVDLGPFTVLVGNNGSGKSSFLQAIELASWAVKYESLNEALAVHHIDFRDLVYLRSPRVAITFSAVVDASDSGPSFPKHTAHVAMKIAKRRYVYLARELILQYGSTIATSPFSIDGGPSIRVAKEMPGAEIKYENVSLGHSLLRDVLLARDAEKNFPALRRVAGHFMGYVHYEIWGPEKLRNSSNLKSVGLWEPDQTGLGKSGENLPALLRTIRDGPEDNWLGLLKELRNAYPNIRDIVFRRGLEKRELGLLFVEDSPGSEANLVYRPSQMSDGFLRILALLAIKYQPTPLALLGYEEPENGLHPSALIDCVRHLKDVVRKGTQVIVTTHSPYLLNYLLEDEAEPRAELRLVLRKKGKTTISKPDPEKIDRARRQGFGVGELWGMLLNEKDLAQK